MKKKPSPGSGPAAGSPRVHQLEVCLVDGPITEEFAGKNRIISRTIEIRGDQTLEQLHETIFDAFDREEEHMYEFQVGGKEPMDPKARRYVLPMAADDPFDDEKPAGVVGRTTMDGLRLSPGQAFLYWFDFGDDWWHRIKVIAIRDAAAAGGKYPRVTARVGESPPQYPNPDDEDEDGDDEEAGDEA